LENNMDEFMIDEFIQEDELDYLTEMVNIAAGNAMSALRHILQCDVGLKIPTLHFISLTEMPSVFNKLDMPAACIHMKLMGDLTGDIFFLIMDDMREKLINLVEQASPEYRADKNDYSVLIELGNIVSGVYLGALHDFCRLNIYHTVPNLSINKMHLILSQLNANKTKKNDVFLMENEFTIKKGIIPAFLIMVPSIESLNTLKDSIKYARANLGV